MTENNEPTSNEYLEMANHAKELVEIAEAKMNLYKNQNIELKKNLLTAYGSVRVLDHFVGIDCPEEINMLVEILRGYLSDLCEKYII